MKQNDFSAPAWTQLTRSDEFHRRHIGVSPADEVQMLATLGCANIDDLIEQTIPAAIRTRAPLDLPAPATEARALAELSRIADLNAVWRSYIGAGYYNCFVPEAIRRNVLENPGWYTAYTPYQAEISQGRLEALLNFQQMVIDLTGLPVANASLLDEATATAEAMSLLRRVSKSESKRFFVDARCHPQVIAVMQTRARGQDIELVVGDAFTDLRASEVFGAHLQYPDTLGSLRDPAPVIANLHEAGVRVSIGADLLALLTIKSPGALGADVAIGSAQRFGVPMGYGGPHAAFLAVRAELTRALPGRIIGVSKDAAGQPALRMALQTREQHIRRDRATSNICTAQALLANMASFYAIYHGPLELERIARRVNFMTRLLVAAVRDSLAEPKDGYFDTVVFDVGDAESEVRARAQQQQINLRYFGAARVGVSFDETVRIEDVADVAEVLLGERVAIESLANAIDIDAVSIPLALRRKDAVLTHPVFNRYHSETEFVRYLKRLENKDLSLVHSMIPLGSCTMKLNAAAEMAPVSWPKLAALHPYVPQTQARGYVQFIAQLGAWLARITGFAQVSFQPNSGAQGEYAGLLAIRRYHEANGQGVRDVCLVPASAHGTNPASAHMIGMRVVVVECDAKGNVDVSDLSAKVEQHAPSLAALMITYPSTHGVFEQRIKELCDIVHSAGAQVYLDGANLNALAGLARPIDLGADVCHINLHKTFCIPHGGGGPGMGPIAVAPHLAPFLPDHPWAGEDPGGPTMHAYDESAPKSRAVSSAPFGSALILSVSWMYLRMMGASGIERATKTAILNANYIAARLQNYFPVLYSGANARVAHECILDLRHLRGDFGVTAEDIAKRLMDYGFHAPTLSFPVADTLMIEPTESESKAELDRFCDAMIAIHGELQRIAGGEWDRIDNPLKQAPHTAEELAGEWTHSYSRAEAAYPLPWVRAAKFWPPVKRIDNAAGDRQLVCTCPPIESYR